MLVTIHARVLRIDSHDGQWRDKVSGESRTYHSVRMNVCDDAGYVGVFTWSSDKQPLPLQGEQYDFLLRKFEDSSQGATGLAVGYLAEDGTRPPTL